MNRQIYVPDAPRFIMLHNIAYNVVYLYEYIGVCETSNSSPNSYFDLAGESARLEVKPIEAYTNSTLESVSKEWNGCYVAPFRSREVGGTFYGMYFNSDYPPHYRARGGA